MTDGVGFYSLSVGVCLRQLGLLRGQLLKAQAFLAGQPNPAEAEQQLLASRLAPDMFSLQKQVEISCNMSLRGCFELARLSVPPFDEPSQPYKPGLEGLMQRLHRAQRLLDALPNNGFEALGDAPISHDVWGKTVSLPPAAFALDFLLPNLYFHMAMVYALLRQAGVPLGKFDFDGHTVAPQAGSVSPKLADD